MNSISAASPGLSGAYQAQLQSRQVERQQQSQPPAPPPVQQAAQVQSSPGKGVGQSIDIRA
jgi:hypothetical protein